MKETINNKHVEVEKLSSANSSQQGVSNTYAAKTQASYSPLTDIANAKNQVESAAHTTATAAKTSVAATKATVKGAVAVAEKVKDTVTKFKEKTEAAQNVSEATQNAKEMLTGDTATKATEVLTGKAKAGISVEKVKEVAKGVGKATVKVSGKVAKTSVTASKKLGKSALKNTDKLIDDAQTDEQMLMAKGLAQDATTAAKASVAASKAALKGGRVATKAGVRFGKRGLNFLASRSKTAARLIGGAQKVFGTVTKAIVAIGSQIFSFVTGAAIVGLPVIVIGGLLYFMLFSGGAYQATQKSIGDLEGVEAECALALYDLGFSRAAVAGVLGNIKAECGFVYNRVGNLSGRFNYAYEVNYGLFQFTDAGSSPSNLNGCSGFTSFKRWCASRGVPIDSVKSQIDYQFAESGGYGIRSAIRTGIPGYYRSANVYNFAYERDYDKFKQLEDPGQAAFVFMAGGERPAASVCHLNNRVKYAREYFERMGKGGDLALNDGTLSDVQRKLVHAAKWTPSAGYGYCAAWVTNVYRAAGVGAPPGNACDQYYRYCKYPVSAAFIKPGMLIAVPYHNLTPAGRVYGHVGIYIGNGQVMHNIGKIETISLDAWLNRYGRNIARCGWGY